MVTTIMPLVSIVIPCYNSRHFVGEAIDSAYKQTYRSIEVIVIDDGSTDGSLDFIADLKQTTYPELILLRHLDGRNCGVSSTRYLGVTHAKGKYVAFLDADDQFVAEKIEKQVSLLESLPKVVLCHSGVRVIGDRLSADAYEKNFGTHPIGAYDFRKLPGYLKQNGVCNSSVMVRTDVLTRVPFAMPQLFQYEDWLCWGLVSAYGRFQFIDEALTRHRVHNASATASVNKSRLRRYYSLLEFKLALATKSESTLHSLRCLMSAANTTLHLLRAYAQPVGTTNFQHEVRTNSLIKMAIVGIDLKNKIVSALKGKAVTR